MELVTVLMLVVLDAGSMWLTRGHRIRETPVSNLDAETSCLTGFSLFISNRVVDDGVVLDFGHFHFVSYPFQLVIHYPSDHSTL
jgi:hypothetical protein